MISAKREVGNHLHAVFSANCGTAPTCNQIERAMVYFDITGGTWLDGVIGMLPYNVLMV